MIKFVASIWHQIDPRFSPHGLGLLPDILIDLDTRPVKEQLEDRYAHGGGFRPMRTSQWRFDPRTMILRFPGDPPFRPAAYTMINGEKCIFYPQASLLCIVQPDGEWEVTRVD